MSERRITGTLEFRAGVGGGLGTVYGHAAVFRNDADKGTFYQLDLGLFEALGPNCFDRTLADGDATDCLIDHDESKNLGSLRARSLRLATDGRGLFYECRLSDTPAGREVVAAIRDGSISGSSFGFWGESTKYTPLPGGGCLRTLLAVKLRDVSPVRNPAYVGSSAGLRSASGSAAAGTWAADAARMHARAVAVELEVMAARAGTGRPNFCTLAAVEANVAAARLGVAGVRNTHRSTTVTDKPETMRACRRQSTGEILAQDRRDHIGRLGRLRAERGAEARSADTFERRARVAALDAEIASVDASLRLIDEALGARAKRASLSL